MQYSDALKLLTQLGPEMRPTVAGPPRKFSLTLIRTLLTALGEPQRAFRSVLIAGTNGKGSTAATLASVAAAAGVRTGLYTSPHLLRVNERICAANVRAANEHVSNAHAANERVVNMSVANTGVADLSENSQSALCPIPDAAFGRLVGRVQEAAGQLVTRGELPHGPSFFELLTAVGFAYFADQKIELAILEVGLGGRLDATNAVEPIVSVITDIGMDHMDYLGETLAEIATEKAGILREEGVLVTLSQHPEANAAIGERAMALNVRGVDASRFLPARNFGGVPYAASAGQVSPLTQNTYEVALDGEILQIASPLPGQHQQRNIALAVAAAVELRTNHGFAALTNEAIESGVRKTVWPGRLEWLPGRLSPSHQQHAPLLLDVAHNPAGAWTLRWAIAQLPEDMPRTLLFSSLADKQIDEMARILLPMFDSTSGDPLRVHDHVVLAPIANARAAGADQLLAAAASLEVPAHAAPHVPAALTQAEAITPPHGLIVVTGSIFLVAEVRALAVAEHTT